MARLARLARLARRYGWMQPLGHSALLALLSLGCGLAPSPLAAQVPVGVEITLDARPGSAFSPQVGLAADGSFVATWLREGTLYARLYRANGQPRGAAIRVTRPEGLGSALSVNPDGSFLVVWPKGQAVVGWRFDKNGAPIGRVFNVNAVSAGRNNSPSIGRAPNGTFVVAWDRLIAPPSTQDEAPYDIFVRRFAADGRPLSGELNVTRLREEQARPELAVDAAGRFALVYWRYTGEGTFYDVEARRLGTNAAPRGPAIFVNSDIGEEELSQIEPTVAMAADGSFTILWSGNAPPFSGGGQDISGRQFTADGVPRGPVFQVEAAAGRLLQYPEIAMRPDGRFLAVWNRRISASPAPGRLEGRLFTADATPLGDVFAIDTPSSGQPFEAAVALNTRGGGVAVWGNFDPVTRKTKIVARRLAPAPI